MNNQEVIVRNALPTTGLIAHSKALEAAGVPSAWSQTSQPALGWRASQAVVAKRGRL